MKNLKIAALALFATAAVSAQDFTNERGTIKPYR